MTTLSPRTQHFKDGQARCLLSWKTSIPHTDPRALRSTGEVRDHATPEVDFARLQSTITFDGGTGFSVTDTVH